MKKRYASVAVLGIVAALVVLCPVRLAAVAPDCSEPPFIRAGVESNLMFILDNSGSMCEFAYKEAQGVITVGSTAVTNSTTVQWSPTCANQPACGGVGTSYYNNCPPSSGGSPCSQSLNWSVSVDVDDINGVPHTYTDSGTCSDRYKCFKRTNPKRCDRDHDTGYPTCTRTSGSTSWSYTCDGGGCTVTISQSVSGADYQAFMGYDPGKTYFGLFNSEKTYQYDQGNHFFYTGDGPDWDVVKRDVTIPGTPPKIITVRGACLAGGTCNKFSGNWLNWLTMRRIDVAKKVPAPQSDLTHNTLL